MCVVIIPVIYNIACGVNCHAKCAKNMPNLCGVNEKLLSEALKNVDDLKKSRRMVRTRIDIIGEEEKGTSRYRS